MATVEPTATKPTATPVASALVVDAQLNFLRMSPRKVRLVAAAVAGMDAPAAVDYLKLVHKLASRPLAKLIASAIANGEHNFGARADNLYIKRILVNQGPTLKRWQPKAYGRAGKIRKRSAHIRVELVERVPSAPRLRVTPAEVQATAVSVAPKAATLDSKGKPKGGAPPVAPKREGGSRPRTFFSRKTG